MTMPPLPAARSTNWTDWAEGVDTRVRTVGDTTSSTSGQVVQASKVTGDTTNRFERRADGTIAVGPGGTTPLRNTEAFWAIDTGAETTRHGLVIYTSSSADNTSQGLVVFDHLGAPIFAVPKAGGPAVFGDNFRVFNGGEVFVEETQLRMDGTIRARKGDTGDGVGVIALGAATTPPTRSPDGSAAGTVISNVLWVDANGRLWSHRGSGGSEPIGGSWSFTSPPTVGVLAGDRYYNTTEQRVRYYDSATWRRPALADLTKRTVTANYTLVAADALDRVLHSTAATAVTITLPSDTAAVISQEVVIRWRQFGAGQITFAAGSGATLVSRGSLTKSNGQYAEGTVTKVGANAWLLSGDIAA